MNKKIVLVIFVLLIIVTGCGKKEEIKKDAESKKEDVKQEEKIEIINMESNTRPYAFVINNYPEAVKVQSGLDKAYVIYEFPIEGGMSRSLALYKDVTDVKIGTIRSARHDYIDYVLENDAIFVHFGWNHKTEDHVKRIGVDNINGLFDSPFWRENPEGLPYEHTAYTNIANIIKYNENSKKYRTTTDVKPPLNYSTDDVDLGVYDDAIVANDVEIPYHSTFKIKYKYNSETKKYDRYFNDSAHVDYFTKKQYDCKNILILLIDWGYVTDQIDAAGSNYLDLNNVGTGKGYYITNGYSRNITWTKNSEKEQTVYRYLDGTEVEINDGNTWIMFQSKNESTKIK